MVCLRFYTRLVSSLNCLTKTNVMYKTKHTENKNRYVFPVIYLLE